MFDILITGEFSTVFQKIYVYIKVETGKFASSFYLGKHYIS